MKKLLILILLIVSSCTAIPNGLSFLRDSNCQLPCWNDIYAGKTTKQDFLGVLDKLSIVDKNSIVEITQNRDIFNEFIYFSLYPEYVVNQHHLIDVRSSFVGDKIAHIYFSGKLNITFNDILTSVGEPENIIVQKNPLGGIWITVIYPAKGISFGYASRDKDSSTEKKLASTIEIEWLVLFDPEYYQQIMDARLFSMGWYGREDTEKIMYPWKGYGNIEELYPPRLP